MISGALIVIGGIVAVLKVDRRWRLAHLQCCRCLRVWFGRDKLREGCGARGEPYDHLARKLARLPTHDWQGYLDTGPVPRVDA